jgi:ribosomal-protein-alanine N-acetyltransferase
VEQGNFIELVDPDRKVAALFEERAKPAQAVASTFRIRRAEVADVPDMAAVERQAFPTLFPPTRFRREIQRSNASYLVAVRDWTMDELKRDPSPLPPVNGLLDVGGAARWLGALPRKLVFQRIGGRDKLRPPEYVAGLVGLWFVLDEAHVVIIGIKPEDRRKGLGELLLIASMEAAIRKGSRVVTLEVRSSNEAARALYGKYGFQEVGVRKRYYADNNEDAVIMTTPPIQNEGYKGHFHRLVHNHADRWGEAARYAP